VTGKGKENALTTVQDQSRPKRMRGNREKGDCDLENAKRDLLVELAENRFHENRKNLTQNGRTRFSIIEMGGGKKKGETY